MTKNDHPLRAFARRHSPTVLAMLAALALTACGGGAEADETSALEALVAQKQQQQQLLSASVATVTMTKVQFTNSDGQALTGFLFRDNAAQQRNAAVVLMHGCSGVWSNSVVNTEAQPPMKALSHIHRRWGEQLAQQGFRVLLVDSFTERGLTNECGNGTAGLDEAVVRPRDALAGRAWLMQDQAIAGHRVALLGWSNGASATLAAMDQRNAGGAFQQPFREAFAFYPGCGLLNNFGGDASTPSRTDWLPSAPVTIHAAALDPLNTDGRCANRVAGAVALGAGSANGNAVAMTVHAGARHSFDQVDLSKPLAAPYTAQDQAAQTAADAAVQARLAVLFPIP